MQKILKSSLERSRWQSWCVFIQIMLMTCAAIFGVSFLWCNSLNKTLLSYSTLCHRSFCFSSVWNSVNSSFECSTNRKNWLKNSHQTKIEPTKIASDRKSSQQKVRSDRKSSQQKIDLSTFATIISCDAYFNLFRAQLFIDFMISKILRIWFLCQQTPPPLCFHYDFAKNALYKINSIWHSKQLTKTKTKQFIAWWFCVIFNPIVIIVLFYNPTTTKSGKMTKKNWKYCTECCLRMFSFINAHSISISCLLSSL